MRFNPSPMVAANLTASVSASELPNKGFSNDHSQKVAMVAARSAEILEETNPDSMIGVSAVAALMRLISGVARGILFDMSSL